MTGHDGEALGELRRILSELENREQERRPDGADRFLWSAELLDELSRTVESVARIVDLQCDGDSGSVTRRAAELSTAITNERNDLLRHGRGARSVSRESLEPRREA